MKTFALFAGAALVLAACGGREAPTVASRGVSDIVVNTDLQSLGNAEAVQYWQTLNSDLETALAAEFVNSISPTGPIVTVDVSEIALADFINAPVGSDQARLSGRVTVSEPVGTEIGVYDVTASAAQAASFLPPGADITTVPRTSSEYYSAVVQAFASGVADTVRAIP